MLTVSGSNIPLAPQALAELQPIIPEGYYYPDYVGMDLEYKHALYGEIYQRSPWPNVVINKRANAVARLPVETWDVNGDTRTLDTRSAYATLVADPCPYMDPYSFWFWVQANVDIYGEAYLAIQRDGNGKPASLMPMHPTRVAIKRDPKDGRYTYFFQAGSGVNTELVNFPEEDVVPFKLFHPSKLERGFSKLEAIRRTIFSEDSSQNAQTAMLKNGARPNIVLTTPNRLGTAGRQRLRKAFDDAHAGSSNTGSTLVLEDGLEAAEFQISAVDLELIESRKMNREEIAAVYDIAPTLIGILEHATFSNITEQMRAFYRDTMAPAIEFIQSCMDKYVGSQWTRDNVMRFAVDEVIRGDYETRMEAAHKGVQSGIYTPNEAREFLGLNRMDDAKADKLYANSTIQPLGEPAEQIRLMGQVQGQTPDGVPVTQIAQQTPVASLDGSKPNTVPALPKPPPPKHFREINSQVGRGKTPGEIKAYAKALAEKYPDDLEDILTSVQLAIAERDRKGK